MYICCVLGGNIHILTATQQNGPYQKKNKERKKERKTEVAKIWLAAVSDFNSATNPLVISTYYNILGR